MSRVFVGSLYSAAVDTKSKKAKNVRVVAIIMMQIVKYFTFWRFSNATDLRIFAFDLQRS